MSLIKSRRAVNCLAIAVAFVMTLCVFASVGTTKAYAATSYSLWVGGTRVTSDNANSNSKWSYNASTRTLTLKSYTYTGKGYAGKITIPDDDEPSYYNAPIYWSGTQELTINVTGTNKVTATYITDSDSEPIGIFARGSVKFTGSGTLTATGGNRTGWESIGVYSLDGDVTLKSGTLNAIGAADCSSFGIYAERRVFVNGGTLNATGGTLYTPEAEDISTGIYSEYLVISGGTVNATGGTAAGAASAGFCSSLRMNGGTLSAKGGSAGVISAGAYFDGSESQMIVGGTATFTGGSCSRGSYGMYNLLESDIDGVDTEPSSHLAHYTANVTAKGNTAASNQMFDYDYDDENLLDYCDDDEGGFVVHDDDDDGDEEETVEKVGNYYIYSKRYAPIIKAGNSVDGSGTTRYVAPDPELDIYTNRKYVNITPAKLPTSVQLSTHNYHQVSSGATMQPTVTYTPSDADIKAVNWSSTNTSVATVNANGLISVVATETGIADIYARVGNCYDACRVSYFKPSDPTPPPVVTPKVSISYDGSEPVIRTKEGTLQLHASVTPSSYASELEWDDSYLNSEIATFNKTTGVLTGHSNGTARIYAKLSGHPGIVAYIDVAVSIPVEEVCDHPYVYDFLNLPATFEQDGYMQKWCSQCGEMWGGEVIPRVSTVELTQTEFDYDGQPKEPDVIIKDRLGKTLERSTDYDLEYYDNVAPGIGRVRVSLNGIYIDTCDLYFGITCEHDFETILTPANKEHEGSLIYRCRICGMEPAINLTPRIGVLELAQDTYEYTGEPIEPEVIVQDAYGVTLTEGQDYDVTYKNNVKIGQATASVKLKDLYEGTYPLNFEIVGPEFKDGMIRLDKKSVRYSKNLVRPEVVIDDAYNIDDFKVKYVNPTNKNVGLHSVIVTSDVYGVNKKLTYVIRPIGTKQMTPVRGRKTITVKWNKQSAKMAKYRITGYQIQYGLKKDMSNARKIKVKGYKTTAKKLSNLRPGKKYYVRVRTYRTVNGKDYYSLWGAKKAITTKK